VIKVRTNKISRRNGITIFSLKFSLKFSDLLFKKRKLKARKRKTIKRLVAVKLSENIFWSINGVINKTIK